MKTTALTLALGAVLLSGCHSHRFGDGWRYSDEQVSIEIEVYDPNTGYVWQDVAVRIIEVEHEWSNRTVSNPVKNDYYYTDQFGIVYFSPEDLGASDLGFLLDHRDRAILKHNLYEDEASVLVEVSAPGLGAVYERIDLSWDDPRVYVQIPF